MHLGRSHCALAGSELGAWCRRRCANTSAICWQRSRARHMAHRPMDGLPARNNHTRNQLHIRSVRARRRASSPQSIGGQQSRSPQGRCSRVDRLCVGSNQTGRLVPSHQWMSYTWAAVRLCPWSRRFNGPAARRQQWSAVVPMDRPHTGSSPSRCSNSHAQRTMTPFRDMQQLHVRGSGAQRAIAYGSTTHWCARRCRQRQRSSLRHGTVAAAGQLHNGSTATSAARWRRSRPRHCRRPNAAWSCH